MTNRSLNTSNIEGAYQDFCESLQSTAKQTPSPRNSWSPSPRNSWRTGHTGPGTESPPGWSTKSCPTDGRFQHLRVTVSLNPLGRRSLLLHSRRVGSEILVLRLPQFLHAPTQNSKDLEKSTNSCDPYAEKPLGDPKSCRPIPLLCVPIKILERLIYARVHPIIDPLLPQEQAGFRHGRSTVDQVTLLTQNIEDSFSAKNKAGAVFVDLTAAYDTVWHRGLTCKLLRLLPKVARRPWAPRTVLEFAIKTRYVLDSWKTSCCPWIFSGSFLNYWSLLNIQKPRKNNANEQNNVYICFIFICVAKEDTIQERLCRHLTVPSYP